MKFNDVELIELSVGEAVMEGRLHHKRTGGNRPQTGYKERWFKLRFNILFYFNLSDSGNILDQKPAGAIVLENSSASYELQAETPFTFSLKFVDEKDRKHLFSGRSDDYINNWVSAINLASYENWRRRLQVLQSSINAITGQDPLLMFYRGTGTKPPPTVQETSALDGHKPYNKTSFRSYIGPGAAKTENSSENSFRYFESGLQFQEDYFGNGLQAIGTLSHASASVGEIQGVPGSLNDLASSFFHVSVDKTASVEQIENTTTAPETRARPRPMRKAPDPPMRPPRGQKINPPGPAIDTNLIDL